MKYLRKYNDHEDFLDDFEYIEQNRITPHVVQCDDPYNDELDVHFHLNIPLYADTFENERTTSFMKRASGGNANIYDISYAELLSIKGVSLVWNQMCNTTQNSVSSFNAQYHTNVGNIQNIDENTIPINHKIYISCDICFSSDFSYSDGVVPSIGLANGNNLNGNYAEFTEVNNDNEWYHQSFIINNNNSSNNNVDIKIGSTSSTFTGSFSIKNLNAIDLTLMWGFVNEPTKEYFEQLFPLNWYAFCLPKFLNLCPYALVSKDTLGNVVDSIILDIPNMTGKLDGEGESVSVWSSSAMCSGSMATKNSLGADIGHDRYDEIFKENGVWKVKIAMALDNDAGDNICDYKSTDPQYFGIRVPNKANTTDTGGTDVIMTKYAAWDVRSGSAPTFTTEGPQRICNSVYHQWGGRINVKDDRYTTSESFKAAISGASIMYGLHIDYVQTYVLDEQYQTNLNKQLKVLKEGTEEIVLSANMNVNGVIPTTAPIRLTIKYTGEN